MPLFNQVFEVFITSVTIVLKVILMAILGILLRRFNILTEDTMSSLSKVSQNHLHLSSMHFINYFIYEQMAFYVLTPCLLLNETIRSVTIHDIPNFIIVIGFSVTFTFISFFAAVPVQKVTSKLFLTLKRYRNATCEDAMKKEEGELTQFNQELADRSVVSVIMFQNSSSIPIGILMSLYQNDQRSLQVSVSAISFYVTSTTLLLYSFGLWYLESCKNYKKPVAELPVSASDVEMDKLGSEATKTPDPDTSIPVIEVEAKKSTAELLTKWLRIVFSPSMIAMMIAMFIALIPSVKFLFLEDPSYTPPLSFLRWMTQFTALNPPLGFITSCVEMLSYSSSFFFFFFFFCQRILIF